MNSTGYANASRCEVRLIYHGCFQCAGSIGCWSELGTATILKNGTDLVNY